MANSPTAEFALDEGGIRTLLRASASALANLPLELVAEGWDNAIWRLGPDLAVRLPRREPAATLIAHEQQALTELGPRLADLGISTPVPVVVGEPSALFPWPWSVVPWIAGQQVLGLPRAQNAAWAAELSVALAAVHQTAPDDAPPNPFRGVPLSSRDDVVQQRLVQFPDEPALRAAWDAGLAAAPSAERVWIHGDLHPGNMLVHYSHLTALIDFGDATAGDPAYDVAASWLLFDAEGRDAFRAATGSRYDDATWTRARGWAAYLALVFLTQSDDRPELLTLGRDTARELAGC